MVAADPNYVKNEYNLVVLKDIEQMFLISRSSRVARLYFVLSERSGWKRLSRFSFSLIGEPEQDQRK